VDREQQMRIVSDRVQGAVDYARDELNLTYVEVIGILQWHILTLFQEANDQEIDDEPSD
jgi:hypothetical protein